MIKQAVLFVQLLSAAVVLAGPVSVSTVDFEDVTPGTRYGSESGYQRGEVALQQDGILMTLAEFQVGEFRGFYRAEVGGAYSDYFPSAALETNNINVVFHFDQLPFDVSTVFFDFAEFGGMNNFAVNGSPLLELSSLQLIPLEPAPGIRALVIDGFVALSGPIESLLIGGQELSIDNVTAVGVPEPGVALLASLGVGLLIRKRRRASS